MVRPKLNVNPFAQSARQWRLSFRVPLLAVLAFEEALSEDADMDGVLAVSSFEDPADHAFWTVQILFSEPPLVEEVRAILAPLADALSLDVPEFAVTEVEQEDWHNALTRDFPPLVIGRFFVHGAHAKALKPAHLAPLQVEAGMAFGSGEHATTSGCLHLLERLARANMHCERVLDVGCGSGILAIAAARCFPRARMIATDIDAVSVRIANDNIRINRVSGRVRAAAAHGYRHRLVAANAPYDIILANILARPLISLSHDLAAHLRHGGYAILSGLLTSQEPAVLAAHRRQGLKLAGHFRKDGWSALLLKK